PLLVGEIERHSALIDSDERDKNFLAHEARSIDFRFAPSRGKPVLRNECEHYLATMGSLLQGFLPALACYNSAFWIEIEKDIIPAVGGKPIADFNSLLAVAAGVAYEDAGHGAAKSRYLATRMSSAVLARGRWTSGT